MVSNFAFSQTTINVENFETGTFPFTYWNDGGNRCDLNTSSEVNGNNSVRIFRKNSIATLNSDVQDFTSYDYITISFSFKMKGMEAGDDFRVQFSDDGGANFTELQTYNWNLPYLNNTIYNETLTVYNSGVTTFSANSMFRFRCRGNANNDEVFLDDITVVAYRNEINVQGNGNDITDGFTTISPTYDTDFGSVNVSGSDVTNTFTIQNTGISDLSVSNITSSNTHFTISNITLPSTVSASSSVTFDVTFDPTVVGTEAGTITITNNDVDEASYEFDVEGIGAYYCDSNGNNSDGFFTGIRRVKFNTIDNPTPVEDNDYSDFTQSTDPTQTTDVTRGSTHSLTVNVNSDGNWTIHVFTWIDWNQDGDFDDADEEYDLGDIKNVSNGPLTNSILIPSGALIGQTRMRVSAKWPDDPISCETGFDGEVEDYTINIIGCSTNTWTGTIDSDWNNTGNWSCGEIPTNSINVNIPSLGVTNFPEIYSGDSAGILNNITIESGATLKVFDNYIEISGTLLLNGDMDLVGEGQLIQITGSIFDPASSGTLERDQQGEGNRFRYNDWSSPVYTATDGNGNYTTISASLRDGTNASSPGSINYTSGYSGSTSPLTLSTYWMYKYANLPDDSYSSWAHIGNTGTLYAGEGFLMKGAGDPGASDQNYVFVGKPNNGTIQLTVSGDNVYLVGNPYPSSIDADQFMFDNASTLKSGTGLYFWDHYGGNTHYLADYQAGYATYTLSGGVPASAHASVDTTVDGVDEPTRYIPVSQGFFVWGDGDGGTIEFNNGQRMFVTEGSGNSIFLKGASAKTSTTNNSLEDLRTKLRIGFEAPAIDHRQLLLTIDDRTTKGVDQGFEGLIYEVLNDDMYWIIDNNKYVIQGSNELDLDSEYPIGLQSKNGGLISIKVDGLINAESELEVYVLDKTTNITYDIKNNTFEVVLEPNTNVSDKYAIVFKENIVLSVDDVTYLEENISIYLDNSDSELVIKNNSNSEILEVSLFNYIGQSVVKWNNSNELEKMSIRLPFKNILDGVYIAKIKTSTGTISRKILVNK